MCQGPTGRADARMAPDFYEDAGARRDAPSNAHSQDHSETNIDVDVAVIGNGPAGVFLSFLLAGNWPYYSDAAGSHPIPFLHNRLASSRLSLLEQDLEALSEGLWGRSNNPVSVLFDTLQRPNADMGDEEPSRLEWRKDATRQISHVVLGSGPVGGSWRDMHPSMCSLSCGEWMGLPSYTVSQWFKDTGRDPATTERMQRGDVGLYYDAFVRKMGLEHNFVSGVHVDSVVEGPVGGRRWIVRGRRLLADGDSCVPVIITADRVVLATGTFDAAKQMGVEGEHLPFVRHRLKELSCAGSFAEPPQPQLSQKALVVVGGGLAAADAVLLGLSRGMRVVHAFVENPHSPSYVIASLPKSGYADYHRVLSLMRGGDTFDPATGGHYAPLPGHRLDHIEPSGACVFRASGGEMVSVTADEVAVLIGIKPCLSYVEPEIRARLARDAERDVDWKKNPIVVDPFTFETDAAKGLFAVGPLVGDNFVRFVLGGPIGVASHIVRTAALNG